MDFSYASPRAAQHQLPPPRSVRQSENTLGQLAIDFQANTLPDILASYLISCRPVHHHPERLSKNVTDGPELLRVFSEANSALLNAKGYSPSDVVTWAWVLTAPDSHTAALRLALAEQRTQNISQSRPVPTFVLLFLLRRHHISARSLKVLINLAWVRLKGVPPGEVYGEGSKDLLKPDTWSFQRWKTWQSYHTVNTRMNETTIMTLIVRLLRHARQVWPPAIVNITEMFSTHIDDRSSTPSKCISVDAKKASRLTFLFNRALSLLAVPSSVQPFLSIPHHQRAQFNLVRRMNEYDPVLPINQEGYRAITRVQLAHKKTLSERQWEEKKAKSWPPWKQDKLGIDTEAKETDGKTRATEAMARMREAGYPGGQWEKVASIFAGWDTDKSPTIQTRVVAKRSNGNFTTDRINDRTASSSHSEDDASDLWAARIRATRTVQEAWACFLIREDRRLPPSPTVYHAMFEKLVFEGRRVRHQKQLQVKPNEENGPLVSAKNRKSMPGDGREVSAAPIYLDESVYLRSDPPSVMELFERLVREGVRPSERCLAFLVSHAESVATGIKFLQESRTLTAKAVSALINVDNESRGIEAVTREIRDASQLVFTAFVRLLCRASGGKLEATSQETQQSVSTPLQTEVKPVEIDQKPTVANAVLHAFRLMHSTLR